MQFLAGTYTQGTQSQGLYCLNAEPASALQAAELDLAVENPSFLCAHPTRPKVYLVEEMGADDGGGWVSSLVAEGGTVRQCERHSTRGDDPCHLAVSPDGRWLAVANYSSGTVQLFSLDSEGEIEGHQLSLDHRADFARRRDEPGRHSERQAAPHAHFVYWRDDDSLMICDLGNDEVYCYEGNPEAPAQGPGFRCTRRWTLPRGSGPRHLAFSSDPDLFWVLAELSNQVFVCHYEKETVGIGVPTLPSGCDVFSEAAEIVFNEEKSELWVSNRGLDDVVCFDTSDNQMLAVKRRLGTGAYPRHFTWVRGLLVVASRDPGRVEIFDVELAAGQARLVTTAYVPAVVCVLPLDGTAFGQALRKR